MNTEHYRQLVKAAIPYYLLNEAGRPYHNFVHALQVMDNVIYLHDHGTPTPHDILLAAIWHDAVYTPGSRDGLNEEASAAALDYEWKRLGIDAAANTLNNTKRLIEGTKVSIHTRDNSDFIPEELGILLDADLGSLAAPYEEFVKNQANIFAENSGDPTNAGHVIRQKDFLEKFLTVRPFIYHTRKAQDMWEMQARANIKLFITT